MEKKEKAIETLVPTIYEAILNVMKDVKNIEKSMTVGAGQNSYKGVSDKDVKFKIGKAMEQHNLIILPVAIEPKLQIDRWEETSQYGVKQKQSVFTEVITTYRIIHTLSGEHVEIKGYGHGVDSQDKSAGKATTYALKYALLYAFMVPTGEIDDADKTHSVEVAPPPHTPAKVEKLQMDAETFEKAKQAIIDNKTTVDKIKAKYMLNTNQVTELLNLNK
jgi:hypothetical protein